MLRRMMGKQQFTLKREKVSGGSQEVSRKSSITTASIWKMMMRMKKWSNVERTWVGGSCEGSDCQCATVCLYAFTSKGTIIDDDDQLISVIENQCMRLVETSESICLQIMWSHWVAGRWQAALHCHSQLTKTHVTIIWWWWPPPSTNIHLASSFHYSFL